MRLAIALLCAFAIVGACTTLWLRSTKSNTDLADMSPNNLAPPHIATPSLKPSSENEFKIIATSDIPSRPAEISFTAQVPRSWQIEAAPQAQAINFLDPASDDSANIDKSQVFVRFFKANDFLTLRTVHVLERTSLKIAQRPAVRYRIQKKSSAPLFASQPAWRNEEHVVTDIRTTPDNPAIFYVIAKRPSLDDVIYENFLSSITFTPTSFSEYQAAQDPNP
jgi:hypothetical protein